MLKKRIMGLDYGSKTIGVAVSDLLGLTAQGIETININEQIKDFKIKHLKELVKEYDVGTIVVGLPKNMDNSVGFRGEATLYFVDVLKNKIKNVEIILQDERLTTMGANRVLLEANVSRKKRKDVIDKMAAVLILQTYLDKFN
ncbi:Holliday junction resolvase RuvX [Gemella cuniculi]|uniref:Holliday junction resolvase RuvX n=1 Tax=Gemella cuniculi TaxID=150240 RepID=UPI0004289097|nr:Holliday junction resolvase RuvX [Gemella cuniculi]